MNVFDENLFYDPLQLHSYKKPPNCINEQELALINEMRTLWQQHIAWTRMTISSLVFHVPDAEVAAARLVKTGTDMGDSLVPFYGELVGHTYGQLLKEHVELAGDLVKALMAGQNDKAAEIEKRWYRNGDEIALFVSSINPFIDREAFREMFYAHLGLIKAEMVYLIHQDFKADVQVFDRMVVEGLEMADLLSGAIRQQFEV